MNTENKTPCPCNHALRNHALQEARCHIALFDMLWSISKSLERIETTLEAQNATSQKILIDTPSSPDTYGLELALEGIQKGIEAIGSAMLSKHDFAGIEAALKDLKTGLGNSQ